LLIPSSFFAGLHGKDKTIEYENNSEEINKFKHILKKSFVVLETTGGYEMALLMLLCDHNIAVHRANTRHVKNFIRSWGQHAKTDALDAKALALYGFERYARLDIFQPLSPQSSSLYRLTQRRIDLKKIAAAEKNRAQAPNNLDRVQESCVHVIALLEAEIQQISAQIKALIEADEALLARFKMLKTVPGIGDITAQNLLALLPELGSLSRKQVASLVGLAPQAPDSGKYQGYRRTGHGRSGVKSALFMPAMAAAGSYSVLGAFYQSLVQRGKKRRVALVALMRKIIVIAKARLRDLDNQRQKGGSAPYIAP